MDFQRWLEWYQHNVDSTVDLRIAKAVYEEYYSCNCQSCVMRKEHGQLPLNMGNGGCSVPIQPLDREQYSRVALSLAGKVNEQSVRRA